MRHKTAPYPEIRVEGPNPQYASMILSNIGGQDSEMSSVAMYFYGHLLTQDYPEISRAFHRISIAEMQHLELFGKLALQLGADPRFWETAGRRKRYWSPKYIRYSGKVHRILTDALISEHMAVAKYSKQVKGIRDENIVAVLNRILQDEREHIEILTDLLHTV